MSLINDALKKAARQRSEEQADVAPPSQWGGRKRIPRRGAPMTVKTLVLLLGGGAVLIVASVIVTFVMVARKPEPKAAVEATPTPVAPTPEPPPTVTVKIPDATVVSVPHPSPPPPTAAPVAEEVPSPTAAPAAEVAVPVAAADGVRVAPPPPQSRAERIQTYIDNLRVTGVRAAGAESKALVDGHVYRVNDLLDRALGIRLVQVDVDHLTLVDSTGVTYIKSF